MSTRRPTSDSRRPTDERFARAASGPDVHTTDRSCRLWIRALDSADRKADLADDRRTVGAITVAAENDHDLAVGAVDDPPPNEADLDAARLAQRLPAPGVWRIEFDRDQLKQHEAAFRTLKAPADADPTLSFLIGSCRYPGILFQAREADQIFTPMLQEARGRDGRGPARFALTVAITYMILDGHEIEDNWTQDRINKSAGRDLHLNTIRAYLSFCACRSRGGARRAGPASE